MKTILFMSNGYILSLKQHTFKNTAFLLRNLYGYDVDSVKYKVHNLVQNLTENGETRLIIVSSTVESTVGNM